MNIRYTAEEVGPELGVTINAPVATAAGAGIVPSDFLWMPQRPPLGTASAAGVVPSLVTTITGDIMAPTATADGQASTDVLAAGRLAALGSLGPGADRRALSAMFRGLGAVEHVIMSRSGEVDYPIVGDWECEEQIPGGCWTATGLIAKRQRKMHLGVYKEGSIWRTYLSADGSLVWQGRLLAPEIEDGQVRLNADGDGKAIVEKAIPHRLLYQTTDLSEWISTATGSPFNRDPGLTLDTELEETGTGSAWSLEIGDSLKFVRPARDSSPATGEVTSASPAATFYALDLAAPGITRLAFRVHVFSAWDLGAPDSGVNPYNGPPHPIWMRIVSGRYDETLSPTSQWGTTGWNSGPSGKAADGATVKWYPDPQGAGNFQSGEGWQNNLAWDVSMFYRHRYVGTAGDYTPTPGYSRAPFAYSDRIGDPSFNIAANAGFPTDYEYDGGRTWDNRPFARPSGYLPAFPASTNFADPAAMEWVGQNGYDGGNVSAVSDIGDYFPTNWIQVYWADGTSDTTTSVDTAKAQLHNVRVNGIAEGDYFTATDLARDIAQRIGISASGVDICGVNILPYDVKEGNWGDALDHAALMAGWIWRVSIDGFRRSLDFYPWSSADTWEVDDPRTPRNLRPTPTYNAISIPYHYPGKNGGVEAMVHVRRPEIAPSGTRDYGVLQLDQALPGREKAEHLGHIMLRHLHRARKAGDMTVSNVRSRFGVRGSGYLIHAGDVVDFTPTHKHHLRVQSVRKTYEGVELTFAETSPVVDAIVERVNHSLSRRR